MLSKFKLKLKRRRIYVFREGINLDRYGASQMADFVRHTRTEDGAYFRREASGFSVRIPNPDGTDLNGNRRIFLTKDAAIKHYRRVEKDVK